MSKKKLATKQDRLIRPGRHKDCWPPCDHYENEICSRIYFFLFDCPWDKTQSNLSFTCIATKFMFMLWRGLIVKPLGWLLILTFIEAFDKWSLDGGETPGSYKMHTSKCQLCLDFVIDHKCVLLVSWIVTGSFIIYTSNTMAKD